MIAHKYEYKDRQKPESGAIRVLPATHAHAQEMQQIACMSYNMAPEDWHYIDVEQYHSRIDIFPAGQFVALDSSTGKVIGFTSSMRIDIQPSAPLLDSWERTTGYGWLTTHHPQGAWMYGVETCVHPEHQSRGVGSRLMNARFDLVRRLNLRGIIAGSLFMDYHKVADQLTPEQYVREVVRGLRYDSNLTNQLHKGFRVLNLIPNYTTDPRTLNWAAAIVWDNPDWHAPKAHGRIIPGRFNAPRPAPQARAGQSARGIWFDIEYSRCRLTTSQWSAAPSLDLHVHALLASIVFWREHALSAAAMSSRTEPASHRISIVPSARRYVAQMEALQHLVYGTTPEAPGDVLRADHFRQHLKVFPEGQFVALDAGHVVGLTVSMRLAFDPANPFIEPWHITTGDGWLTRHDPSAPWMYGVESCVNPAYRGSGIGGKLMEARFNVARQLNLRGMVAGSAIIDYYQVAPQVSPEEYVRGVVEGRFFDTNLSKQVRKGFKPAGLIPNYVDDPGTLGWGVVIVWENPDYSPAFTLPMHVQAPRYRLRFTPGMGRPASGGVQPAL